MKQMLQKGIRTILQPILLLSVSALSQAGEPDMHAAPDSPYVLMKQDDTLLVVTAEVSNGGLRKHTRKAKAGDVIDIPSINRTPSFTVTLRPPSANEAAIQISPLDTALFVVADTHGEYEILTELLQKQNVIDSSMRWSFRTGQLIFLGDVFDRGPNQTEILWLIYELEGQARKAGGAVHLVLGNHEIMAMTGDARYLHSKYARTAQILKVDSYSTLFGSRTILGQWLRTKASVLKLNNLLLLHGGISRELVEREFSLHEINSIVRDTLVSTSPHQRKERAAFVLGALGPLWYRGYFSNRENVASIADVDAIRNHYGVGRILVGHTPVSNIMSLYGGTVIAVQVYPHRSKDGHAVMEALRIEGGQLFRARIDGSMELLH